MIALPNYKSFLLSYVNYLLFGCIFFVSIKLHAQNNDAMYYKKNFYNTSYSKTITYKNAKDYRGINIPLQADLVYPGDANDNSSNVKRPAIILYHGGGFLPGGNRNNPINKLIGNYFNKRGFIAIPASYRLGWQQGKSNKDVVAACLFTKPETHKDVLYRAFQDSRDLVKYLKEHADELKIDPNAIFVLGYSAGAIVAINHLGDDPDLFTPDRANRLGVMPTDELSTKVAGIISIAGAHTAPNTKYNNTPTLFFHGTCDDAVPYKGDIRMLGCPGFAKFYGPEVLAKNLTEQNIYYELNTFCDYQHDFLSKGESANAIESQSMKYIINSMTEFMNNVINGKGYESKEIIATSLPEFQYTSLKGPCAKTNGISACDGNQAPITITAKNNRPIPNLRKELYPNIGGEITDDNNQEYPEFPFKIELVEKEISIYEAIQIAISTPKYTTLTIEIFNIIGNKIAQSQITVAVGESVINLNSNDWNEGDYIISVSEGGEARFVDMITLKNSFF